jgi:hypothetical protein
VPLALAPAVRTSLRELHRSQLSNRPRPLCELRSPLELCPAKPSPTAAADRLLSWAFAPFSTYRIRRSTTRGLCLPASFRPQGLAALSTVFSLRTLAGFVSHRQRSWDSPFGAFSARKALPAFPP